MNTDLLLINFNIRSIGANFNTFNCFTTLLYKKCYVISFSESWLNDNNKNLYTTVYRNMMLFTIFDVTDTEVEVYLYIFHNVNKYKVIHPCTISIQKMKPIY